MADFRFKPTDANARVRLLPLPDEKAEHIAAGRGEPAPCPFCAAGIPLGKPKPLPVRRPTPWSAPRTTRKED